MKKRLCAMIVLAYRPRNTQASEVPTTRDSASLRRKEVPRAVDETRL